MPEPISFVADDDLAALADEVASQGVQRDALARHPEAWGMEERAGERYDLHLGALAFGSAGYIPTKDETGLEHTVWYADENEVVEGASQLGVERLLPTHWDMWRGLTADPTSLYPHVRSYDRPETLELVEIGDSVAV